MFGLEIKEITPEQDEWIAQKVLYAYYDSIRCGSLFVVMGENLKPIYGYEIDGKIEELPDTDFCETWEDAEQIFLEIMFDHFNNEENYYSDLKHMCNELIKERLNYAQH